MAIKNTYYHFNTQDDLPVNPTCSDNETFGVLVLETEKVNITNRPIFILFTIDATGSMSEYVSSNTTKIQYAVQTMKSIIKYLSTLEIDAYIQINTFNEDVQTLISPTKVSTQSMEDMIILLNSIHADGTTNIELALKSATSDINEYTCENPHHSCVHIFMTDGEPTSGEMASIELLKCISNDYLSINIGFGPDHNAKLLCELSSLTNSEYHFIDNIEHASMVYGESLHKVLYPCLHNLRIHIEGGLIYDWYNNTWSNILYENTVIGEITKYYHIKSSTTDDINVYIAGYCQIDHQNGNYSMMCHIEEDVYKLPNLIDTSGNILHDTTIVIFAFRQCVLELLYKATHIVENANVDEKLQLKEDIRTLFRKIRKYAEESNIITDGVVKQLLNDLYLAYWNIGDVYGEIYIHGRHSSQGNQYAHTPGNIRLPNYNVDDIIDMPPRPVLRRSMNHHFHNSPFQFSSQVTESDLELNLNDEDSYTGQTDNEYSCYSTPSIRRTTNSIQQFDD
jgi:hypothetical protein